MDTFNPLDHPICFVVPDRMHAPSAWYEHIPFAFYVTEIAQPKCLVELGTHNGVSYLAFCQAIEALSLNTKSFAIDTWEGDKMAGFYGQEVFNELRAYHDRRYSKFSSLLKMTFDEGVEYFPDNSIDLLHIDGLHTYEAVKHDFENWFKKLSPNAIVLFHDMNVHENDFGVWKYWEEIKRKYTNFEFYHGHGLGVLTLAENFPQGLRVDGNSFTLDKFRNFFAVLGQKYFLENNNSNLQHELGVLRSQIDGFIQTKNEANELLRKVVEENNQANLIRQRFEVELAEEKANNKRQIQALEQKIDELEEKTQIHAKELKKINEVNCRLEAEKMLLSSQKVELETVIDAAKREVLDYYNSTSWKMTRPLRWISNKLRG